VTRPDASASRVRYNIYEMPADARNSLFAAINKIKELGVWDYLVKSHLQVSADRRMGRLRTDAHESPAFSVWHRMMLDLYERSLMAAGLKTGFGAPYWRTEFERGTNGDCMWADDMFGERNGQVTKGFMAAWKGFGDDHTGKENWPITRRPPPQLYDIGSKVKQWQTLLDAKPFPTFAQMRENVEDIHNFGHTNIGGDMNTMASPNDALFYMVHMRSEKQFTEWQAHPDCLERNAYYGINSRGVPAKIEDKLTPWGVAVKSWLDPAAGASFNNDCNSELCRRCGTTLINNHRQDDNRDDQ